MLCFVSGSAVFLAQPVMYSVSTSSLSKKALQSNHEFLVGLKQPRIGWMRRKGRAAKRCSIEHRKGMQLLRFKLRLPGFLARYSLVLIQCLGGTDETCKNQDSDHQHTGGDLRLPVGFRGHDTMHASLPEHPDGGGLPGSRSATSVLWV